MKISCWLCPPGRGTHKNPLQSESGLGIHGALGCLCFSQMKQLVFGSLRSSCGSFLCGVQTGGALMGPVPQSPQWRFISSGPLPNKVLKNPLNQALMFSPKDFCLHHLPEKFSLTKVLKFKPLGSFLSFLTEVSHKPDSETHSLLSSVSQGLSLSLSEYLFCF